ncbi:hypothetical protein F2P46_16055 [Massilia sp. CCM 8734]|nr:hypothetical protein [Massilia sp. CCM 8734]
MARFAYDRNSENQRKDQMLMSEERKIPARSPELAPLKRAAEDGDAGAQVDYAKYLHQQFDDPAEAFRWLERAAAQQHPEGLYILSLFYLNGWNGVQSPGVGFKLMEASAETGFPAAQLDLGLMYIKGTGTAPDLPMAAQWIAKAAAAGLPVAEYEMGLLHLNGEGVERDFLTALGWFKKAADQHHPDGLFYIGAAVYEGLGTDKNPAHGWEIIQEALRMGSTVARNNLQNYPEAAAAP